MITDNSDGRYFGFADPDGSFMIDMDRVAKIVYSYERSTQVGLFSRRKKIIDPSKSWSDDLVLPDIYTYETDWAKVAELGKTRASEYIQSLCLNDLSFQSHQNSVAVPLYNQLVYLCQQTKSNMDRYHQKLSAVSQESMRGVESNVSNWDTAIDLAKFFRDRSADALIIGGTILPPAKFAGAVLKVAGKYQDTGSIGQAAFEGVANIVFMSIPDPSGKRGKIVLLLAKSVTDGAKVYLEKGNIEKAIAAGLISGVSDGVLGKVLETGAAKKIFIKAALPIRTSVVSNEIALRHTLDKILPTMYSRSSRAAIDLSKKVVAYAPEQAVKKSLSWVASNVLSSKGNKNQSKSVLNAPIFSDIDQMDVGVYSVDT